MPSLDDTDPACGSSQNLYDYAIIIPVYNPSEKFQLFIENLCARAHVENCLVILVNDGCDDSFSSAFAALSMLDVVRLFQHESNLGKGAALKTGFAVLAKSFPYIKGALTADADGQHSINDIFAVLKEGQGDHGSLTLGTRDFDRDVPLRSRVGNTVTHMVFYVLTAIKLGDTQTGLRFVPSVYFKDMCDIKSSGYAFEMEMLLWAKQHNVKLRTKTISTIYLDGNSGSHFRPFVDSVKIYAVLLKQALSSIATSGVDLLMFSLFFYFSGGLLFWANAFSRTMSFPVYYFLNRDFVFKQKALGFHPVPKLVAVIFVSGVVSYFLQSLVLRIFGWPEILSKALIETLMFFVNFVILRDFVFKRLGRVRIFKKV